MIAERALRGRDRQIWAVALLGAAFALVQSVPACGLMAPLTHGQEAPAVLDHIPTVAGSTLSGDKVELPRDLGGSGHSAVLVVGFGRAASGATRDWGKHLAETSAENPSTTYYVLPVVSGVPSFFSGWCAAGDRSLRDAERPAPLSADRD